MWRAGWYCQFLEADLKTPIPRKLVLPDSAKLLELAERGGTPSTLKTGRRSNMQLPMDEGACGWNSVRSSIGS